MMFGKKGAGNMAATVVGGIFLLLVVALVIIAGMNNWDFGQAVNTLENFGAQVITPLFTAILGLKGGANDFLMVLTFALLCIIVVGTLDSVNMFSGGDASNGWINFIVGIIVSIIGVRYMPEDIWASLTAPSSALVAAILMGLPFFALAVITMKMKSRLAAKLFWIFYLVFLAYLVFYENPVAKYKYIYGIFGFLAIIMMLADSTVRKFYYEEKGKAEIESMIGKLGPVERYNIRKDIKAFRKVIADTSAPAADRAAAAAEIKNLEKQYGDLSVI